MARTQDILNQDFRKWSSKEFKEFRGDIQDIIDTANKRLKRLKAKYPDVYQSIQSVAALSDAQRQLLALDKPVFTIKGLKSKDVNQMRSIVTGVKSFIGQSTSTVKGVSAFQKRMEQILGADIKFGSQEYKDFWRVIDEIRHANTGLFDKGVPGSDIMLAMAYEMVHTLRQSTNDVTMEQIYNNLLNNADKLYETRVDADGEWVDI